MAWVAEYHLEAAVSNAGGWGIIGAGEYPYYSGFGAGLTWGTALIEW